MTPGELFQAGKLTEAVDAALSEVKKKPTDAAARYRLSELLCFTGDLSRADRQLETLAQQSGPAVGISLVRQLIRAETARQQFFSEGRLPEFTADVSPALRLHLDASIAIREGAQQEALEILNQAEEQRIHVAGVCDGEAFDDLRDLDDLTSSFFEVLTSTGKYFLVPIENVKSLGFELPQRPLDLLWRRVQISVSGGPDGEVYLPVMYAGTAAHEDDELRLGRRTDWSGGEGTPVRGVGQREFLIGSEAKPIMELKDIECRQPTDTPETNCAEE